MSATKIIRAKVRLPVGVIVKTKFDAGFDDLVLKSVLGFGCCAERIQSDVEIDLELEVPVDHAAATVEALKKLVAEIEVAK